jgi:hypothetical protein
MPFVANQQVYVCWRILLEHANRLKIDIDSMPPILGLHLLQQVPPHGDPADLCSSLNL